MNNTYYFFSCDVRHSFLKNQNFIKRNGFKKSMKDKKLNYTVHNKTKLGNEEILSFQNGEEIISIMTYLMNRPSY